ncbi:MAG: hypothetical protein GY943_27630 [Chloroflexi bacterium]|nr:hypothetical protein [Chloroflexota bacterium]
MKQFNLLDDSLRVNVKYEQSDSDFEDNVRIQIKEVCNSDEKIFVADETNIFLTPDQANRFALALIEAAKQSLGLTNKEETV